MMVSLWTWLCSWFRKAKPEHSSVRITIQALEDCGRVFTQASQSIVAAAGKLREGRLDVSVETLSDTVPETVEELDPNEDQEMMVPKLVYPTVAEESCLCAEAPVFEFTLTGLDGNGLAALMQRAGESKETCDTCQPCETCEGAGECMGMVCYGGAPCETMLVCPDCDGAGVVKTDDP